MAWEWSHSSEAYENAYDNLSVQPMKFLREAAREWGKESGEKIAGNLPKDTLVDFLWDKMEGLRTCDNGGFDAWVCPGGCHTAPFTLTAKALGCVERRRYVIGRTRVQPSNHPYGEWEALMFKPMLACDADLAKLKFPLLASAKLDGVRAIVRDGVVYSRSNKPLPNKFVQSELGKYEYFDGELSVGEPTSKTCYRDTVSQVMSDNKTDYDLRFHVFDHVQDLELSYGVRYHQLCVAITDDMVAPGHGPRRVRLHTQYTIDDLDGLFKLEEEVLGLGYEGLILRSNDAPYKQGRSTVKEGYLLKLKRFTDAEFEVVGFEERMHNANEAQTNELGRTKRSSAMAGLEGRGDLGALVVERAEDGLVFNVGTGLNDADRKEIWDNRKRYLGRMAKVKYFAIGMKDAPRHPVFLGWRAGD